MGMEEHPVAGSRRTESIPDETGDTRYKVKYSSYAMHRVNQDLKFVCESELKDRIKEEVYG